MTSSRCFVTYQLVNNHKRFFFKSHLTNTFIDKDGIRNLVDLGSGKGYLSQALSKLYHLNVLAIDASQGNTAGAQKRMKNLDVIFPAFLL